jgi:hypothetical protein
MIGIDNIQLNINVKDELGIGMPNVGISSITLSNSISLPRTKQDPHIDHPNEVSAASLKDVQEAQENTSMDVSIKMVFKETIDDDGNFSFLSKKDFLEYVNIFVVQCTSPSKSSQISKNYYKFLNPENGQVFKNSSISGIKTKKLGLINSIQGKANLILSAMANPAAHTVDSNTDNITQIKSSELIKQIPFSKEQDANGNIMYNIPLEVKFNISPKVGGSNVGFLSYFAYAYFDIEKFLEDTKQKLGPVFDQIPIPTSGFSSHLMGNVVSDIVILDGNAQQDSFVFVDGDGKYYSGAKHLMPDGQYMKGKAHLANRSYSQSEYLKKKTVPNAKVVDNRETIKIGKANFNYARVSEFITNDDVVNSLAQNFGTEGLIRKKYPIISNFWCGPDIGGKNRFTFSLDICNLLRKNTIFPGLLDTIKKTNQAEYIKIISSVKILDFKISRIRIKESQVADSSLNSILFSKSSVPVAIVHSKDGAAGRLIEKVSLSDQIGPVRTKDVSKLGTINEVFLKNQQQGIRTFSGTDIAVSSENQGEFQYTLTLKVKDPMAEFLKTKIIALEQLLNGTDGSKGWNDYVSLSNYPQYSDDILNRFNIKFLSAYNKSLASVNGSSFAVDVIAKYVSTLFLLNVDEDATSEATKALKMIQYLTNISSPNTGNPEGVQLVAKLINDLIEKLYFVLKQNSNYRKLKDLVGVSDPHSKAQTPNIVSGTPVKTFEYDHVFKKTFLAIQTSLRRPIGFDFLSLKEGSAPANLGGLRVVNSENIKQRFLLETKKLFSSQDADIVIKTSGQNPTIFNPGDTINNKKFSYLAPSYVYLPRRSAYNVMSNGSLKNEDVNEISDLMLDVIRYNNNPSSGFSSAEISNAKEIDLPEKTQRRRIDLINYFSEKGCTLEKVGQDIEVIRDLAPTVVSTVRGENSNISPAPLYQTPFRPEARFQSLGTSNRDELDASSRSVNLSNNELINSSINPNKLLYSLTVLDDLNFINSELEEQERINSLSYYRITSPNGGKKFKQSLFAHALISALAKSIGEDSGASTEPPLVNSPNHVKALILTATKSLSAANSTLYKTINTKKLDGFKDPMMYGFLNFNYRLLNNIQVFRGFKAVNQDYQISSSKWTDLKEADISQENFNSDELLLCRQRRYYNDTNGVLPPKLIEMPFFDEYFFITSQSVQDELNIQTDFEVLDTLSTLSIVSQAGPAAVGAFNNPRSPLSETNDRPDESSRPYLADTALRTKLDYISDRVGTYEPSRNNESSTLRTEATNSNILVDKGGKTPPLSVPKRRTAQKNKEAFSKLSTLEQVEILDSLKLSKLSNLNNINSNASQQKTNGQVRTRDEDITGEELELLESALKGKGLEQLVGKIKGKSGTSSAYRGTTQPPSGNGSGGGGGSAY